MKTKLILSGFRLAVAMGVLVVLGVGCGDKPVKEVNVEADDSIESMSVTLDVVGVSLFNLDLWENYPLNKYWQEKDGLRADTTDRITLEFGRGKDKAYSFSTSDRQWKEWYKRGVRYVVVMADIPGIVDDPPGDANPRRKILPLSRKDKKWPKGTERVWIMVRSGGIQVETD